MSRRLPDGFEEKVGGGDVRAVYLNAFATRGMTFGFAKAVFEGLYGNGKDYSGIPLLKVKDRVLDAVRSIRSGDIPEAVAPDGFVGTVLDVGDNWDLEVAADVDEDDMGP